MLGEKVVCVTIPCTCILSHIMCVQSYSLHSSVRDFSNGVCYVMQVSVTKCNPDMELLSMTFCLLSSFTHSQLDEKVTRVTIVARSNPDMGLFNTFCLLSPFTLSLLDEKVARVYCCM